jgi:hypothetical protein
MITHFCPSLRKMPKRCLNLTIMLTKRVIPREEDSKNCIFKLVSDLLPHRNNNRQIRVYIDSVCGIDCVDTAVGSDCVGFKRGF